MNCTTCRNACTEKRGNKWDLYCRKDLDMQAEKCPQYADARVTVAQNRHPLFNLEVR